MKWIIKNIPNLFTLGNLILGVLAIQEVILNNGSEPPKVHYYVFLAAFFDLLDGAIARALGVTSKIGGELDSLADLITFGVLPTFIYASFYPLKGLGYLILLVPVSSAIRLAVFNTSSDQSTSFKGISTTAHGLFAACLPIILWQKDMYLLENKNIVLIIAIFFSFLMVSPLRMISLKFNNSTIKDNWDKYILLLGSAILAIVFKFESAVWIMILYLVLSLLTHFKNSSKTNT